MRSEGLSLPLTASCTLTWTSAFSPRCFWSYPRSQTLGGFEGGRFLRLAGTVSHSLCEDNPPHCSSQQASPPSLTLPYFLPNFLATGSEPWSAGREAGHLVLIFCPLVVVLCPWTQSRGPDLYPVIQDQSPAAPYSVSLIIRPHIHLPSRCSWHYKWSPSVPDPAQAGTAPGSC